jgi:glutathione peroxidase
MTKLIFSMLLCVVTTSIYTFKVADANGGEIDFDDFRGKKILIVNIATGSPKSDQLAGLQQLRERFSDSLIIICFPSNSFGNENRSNTAIQQHCQSTYSSNYIIGAKVSVTGNDISPLYQWLTQKTKNGAFGSAVNSDFQKYLIDTQGNPVGIFSGDVSPLDSTLINAITNTQY